MILPPLIIKDESQPNDHGDNLWFGEGNVHFAADVHEYKPIVSDRSWPGNQEMVIFFFVPCAAPFLNKHA